MQYSTSFHVSRNDSFQVIYLFYLSSVYFCLYFAPNRDYVCPFELPLCGRSNKCPHSMFGGQNKVTVYSCVFHVVLYNVFILFSCPAVTRICESCDTANPNCYVAWNGGMVRLKVRYCWCWFIALRSSNDSVMWHVLPGV